MSSGRETHPKREVLGLLQSVEKRLIETCANAGFQCENIFLIRHFISSHFFTSCCAFAESALQRLLVLFLRHCIPNVTLMQIHFELACFVFSMMNIVCVKHETTDMFENVSCSPSKCGQ